MKDSRDIACSTRVGLHQSSNVARRQTHSAPPSCPSVQLCVAINIKYNGTPIYAAMMNLGKQAWNSVRDWICENQSNVVTCIAYYTYHYRKTCRLEKLSGIMDLATRHCTNEAWLADNMDSLSRVKPLIHPNWMHEFTCIDPTITPFHVCFLLQVVPFMARLVLLCTPRIPRILLSQSKFDLTRAQQKIYFISLKQSPDGTKDDDERHSRLATPAHAPGDTHYASLSTPTLPRTSISVLVF